MLRVPMDVFAYTNEAAAMARGGRLVFANAAAEELLGSDCVGKSLVSLFGADVAEAQAANFVADVTVGGKNFSMRATKQEGVQLFFLSRGENEPVLLNDAFIYSLRNNLMTLNLALELCRNKAEEQGCTQLLGPMRDISRSQYRLTRLVYNASMLRDHFQGGLSFAPVNVDLARLCRECVECISELVDGVEFALTAPEELFVNVDPSLVEKLLTNLISNCLVHGKGLSRVAINVMDASEYVVISVSDDGCGIDGEQLHRVFDRYRHMYSMEDMNSGAGIGLSLVRLIAQRHGGTLLMESRSDRGTTVRLSLKKSRSGSLSMRSGEEKHFDIKTALIELSDCLDSRYYGEKYLD